MNKPASPSAPAQADELIPFTESELLAADVQRATRPDIHIRAADHFALQQQQQTLYSRGELL